MIHSTPLIPDGKFALQQGIEDNDRESQRPGTILATREILAAQLGFLPTGSVKTYQLLYKTSDQDDRPLASVTTILVPLVRANDRFVSYSVAEDSGNSKCAPSYQCKHSHDLIHRRPFRIHPHILLCYFNLLRLHL